MKHLCALLTLWGSIGGGAVFAQSPWPPVSARPQFDENTLLIQYLTDELPGLAERSLPDLYNAAGVDQVSISTVPVAGQPLMRSTIAVRLRSGTRYGDAYRAIRQYPFGTGRFQTIESVGANSSVFIWTPPGARRVFALSSRMEVGSGDAIAVGGISVPGEYPRLAIIRTRGASLANFGIGRPVANPVLKLFEGTRQIASNDDWATLPKFERDHAAHHGVVPDHAKESLIVTYLDPGAYTAQVSSADGTTGIALLEIQLVDAFYLMP